MPNEIMVFVERYGIYGVFVLMIAINIIPAIAKWLSARGDVALNESQNQTLLIKQIQSDSESLRTRIESLDKQVIDLRAVNIAQDTKITELTARISAQDKRIEELLIQLEAEKVRVLDLEDTKAKREETIAKLTAQIATIQTQKDYLESLISAALKVNPPAPLVIETKITEKELVS